MTIVDVGLVVGGIATAFSVRSMLRNPKRHPRWNLLSVAIISAAIACLTGAMLAEIVEAGYLGGRGNSVITRQGDPLLYWPMVLGLYAATVLFLSGTISTVLRMLRKGSGPEELV